MNGDITMDDLLDFYMWATKQWENRPSNHLSSHIIPGLEADEDAATSL